MKFIPKVPKASIAAIYSESMSQAAAAGTDSAGRIFVYVRYFGTTRIMNEIGKMFASAFAGRDIDVVMTVETKGIPLAYATATYMNFPVVIVRRDNRVTEGSAVSINYVSGSINESRRCLWQDELEGRIQSADH